MLPPRAFIQPEDLVVGEWITLLLPSYRRRPWLEKDALR